MVLIESFGNVVMAWLVDFVNLNLYFSILSVAGRYLFMTAGRFSISFYGILKSQLIIEG